MTVKNLDVNLNFVNTNKETLLKEYKNKFLLVYEGKIIGSYDTYERAAEEGVRLYGIDADFLIYHLTDQEPLNFVISAIL